MLLFAAPPPLRSHAAATFFPPRLFPSLGTPSPSSASPNVPSYRCTPPVSLDTTNPPASPATRPAEPFVASESALLRGIRAVAVGKFGSKPVPPELIPALHQELSLAASAPPTHENLDLHLLRASFLGSLYVKAALSPAERGLLSRVARGQPVGDVTPAELLAVVDAGAAAAGGELASFALRTLSGERLELSDAHRLGSLLYQPDPPNVVGVRPVKALVAHVMRVRHENPAELSGLALAAAESVRAGWFDGTLDRSDGAPFALVAEPFDGAITNDLLTPLLCRRLKEEYGMRPVMAVGASSGPKYGPNLRDVARELGVPFCGSAKEVDALAMDGEFGAVVDQVDCSPGLDSWVHMRRVILKRPGIATAEKYVDASPGGAGLFVASAFHGSYIEKMAVAAEVMQFPAYIIVGKGMEGTTGLGVGVRRTATLLTGWREADGSFRREEVEFNVLHDGDGIAFGEEDDPVKGAADARVTAQRIRAFVDEGRSGDRLFDARARATLQAFDKALAILAQHALDVVSLNSSRS